MGFGQAAVLCSVSFVLGKLPVSNDDSLSQPSVSGTLFVCFNVDHRLLYSDLTEQTVEDGFQFYTTFYNAPPAIRVRFPSLYARGA